MYKNRFVDITIFFCFLLLFLSTSEVYGQKRTLEKDSTKLTAVEKFARYFEFREDKNWVYIPVPTVGYSPETSLLFGMAHQLLYRNRRDTTTTASNLNIAGFYSLNKQVYLLADWNGFFAGDDLFFRNSFEYKYFPLNYFGVGNNTSSSAIATYSGKSISFSSQASFRIRTYLWLGATVKINSYLDNSFTNVSDDANLNLVGKNGYKNFGIGSNIRFDTRDNKLYSKNGFFLDISGTIYPSFLGSTTNNFGSLIDYRQFISPRKGLQTLAWQVRLNNQAGHIPFQVLSSIGGSKFMRGYYSGRFRDQHSFSFQTEYRFPIIKKVRIHGTAFVTAGDVYHSISDIDVVNMKASIGAGVRYILDNNSKTSIRFDYARTRDGANGFYIEVLEAF